MNMISPELLRRFPYFAGVSDASLAQVAMISEELSFRAGQVLFREDEPADRLYLLSRGEVDIQSELAGGERRTVDTLVEGDLMTWSALVEPHRTRFWGVARVDTRTISIDAPALRDLFEKDPRLGYRMMAGVAQAMSNRLAGARVQLATH